MKKYCLCFISLSTFFFGFSQQKITANLFAFPTASPRTEISLNGLWNFQSNADKTPTSIRVPSAYTNVMDGKWGKPYWDAFGYPRRWSKKGAMYQHELEITKALTNKHLVLNVEGCWQNYSVLFEGKTFDTIHDGYSARQFDLGVFSATGKHSLQVRVEDEGTRLSGGESMQSRGIWDDISLIAVSDVFVDKGVVITTSVANHQLSIQAPLKNSAASPLTVVVKFFVTDKTGKVVKTIDGGEQTLAANSTKTLKLQSPWSDPHLWWTHDPYLYHLNTVLYSTNGQVVDWQKERFGFREITWGNAKLYLNGRELWLRGHGEHYLGDIQASRPYFEAWFTELKMMGVNFMRLHIYPRHKILYEVADELGFLLEAEPAFHFKVPEDSAFAKKHLGDMMQNLINHPSIFTWSVSNELRWQGGGEKPWLINHAHSIDKTRPAFASDFSAFSTHGDLIGHHYNTDSVFKEWEQFGPEKPMVWDECGEVWQPNRPLGNGSAGYEVTAQDYATGIYRDGYNEIKTAFNLVREGKEFAGKLHRINAISPWDFGCVFFRWQPYNRFRGIQPTYPSLSTSGVKPTQILPCTTPVNIWDPSLPVYEPNPGYYIFAEDMKWVRFPYDSKHFSFFGGEKASILTPLLQYDDLRFADEVHCKIETQEGKVLSETIQKQSLQPGDMLRNIEWNFNIPTVTTATPIHIVREFWYQGKAGYKDVREGNIYPRLSASLLHFNGKKIGVIDTNGELKKGLEKANIPYTTLTSNLSLIKDIDIVLTNVNTLLDDAETFEKEGHTIIQFKNSDAIDNKVAARLMVNGAPFQILNGITQEALTFWKGGNEYGGMELPKTAHNFRNLLSGDKDGKTSALYESYLGKGCKWTTTLKILQSLNKEPAADWIMHNLLNAALNYKATIQSKKTALLGGADFVSLFKQVNHSTKVLSSISTNSLQNIQVLLLDARENNLTENDQKIIKTFVTTGGEVLVYKIKESTINSYQHLISDSLKLVSPFLNEKAGCVKSAISWTLRNTPKTGVEYYDSTVIPQPFEANYDPFLSGLSNITLNWNGKDMFDKGIKIAGISPVSSNDSFRILVSNWRNDWSVPPFGAEYINEGKDMRQALWYLNRTPVLATSKQGKGEYIICQLDLLNGGEKGHAIMRHLLTNMDCAIGNQDVYFPDKKEIFDFAASADQKVRLSIVEQQLAQLKPLDSVPAILYNMGGNSDGKQRRILLLSDSRFLQIAPDIIKKMSGFGNVSYSGVSVNKPKDFLENVESALGGSKWDVVYLSIGYEGITDFSPSGLEKFDADMLSIVTTLKNMGAKVMWGSQPPLPTAWYGQLDNDKIKLLNERAKKILEANNVLVNDTYGFMMDKTPEYIQQDKKELTLINSEFFKTFTPKLVKTIVEALQFFGN